MLPICFGEATKFSQHLLEANKVYEVTAMLGVRTDTGDAEGRVIRSKNVNLGEGSIAFLGHPSRRGTPAPRNTIDPSLSTPRQDVVIEKEKLFEVLKKFTGEIQQVPPMHSALKHKGRPLYEYARKGEIIDRPARTVTIYNLELLKGQAQDLPLQTISLRVHCSKGTYIRSLIDDIGEKLGCGAHVIALRRTMVEPFQRQPMMTLEALEAAIDRDDYLLPVDAALTEWPQCVLSDHEAKRLLQGLPLHLLNHSSGFVRFYDVAKNFLGVGTIVADGEVTHKRLMSFRQMPLVEELKSR
jgi:tRNA pseudouridine55 synthase